jgi:hypothetical protein
MRVGGNGDEAVICWAGEIEDKGLGGANKECNEHLTLRVRKR